MSFPHRTPHPVIFQHTYPRTCLVVNARAPTQAGLRHITMIIVGRSSWFAKEKIVVFLRCRSRSLSDEK